MWWGTHWLYRHANRQQADSPDAVLSNRAGVLSGSEWAWQAWGRGEAREAGAAKAHQSHLLRRAQAGGSLGLGTAGRGDEQSRAIEKRRPGSIAALAGLPVRLAVRACFWTLLCPHPHPHPPAGDPVLAAMHAGAWLGKPSQVRVAAVAFIPWSDHPPDMPMPAFPSLLNLLALLPCLFAPLCSRSPPLHHPVPTTSPPSPHATPPPPWPCREAPTRFASSSSPTMAARCAGGGTSERGCLKYLMGLCSVPLPTSLHHRPPSPGLCTVFVLQLCCLTCPRTTYREGIGTQPAVCTRP